MVHTVIATFKFKTPEDKQSMVDLLSSPQGLTVTRTFDGCIGIRCYEGEEDTMVIFQEWESKAHHGMYLKMRQEEGLLGKVQETLREDLHIVHLETVRA